jgi:hypothetical protein
VRSARSRARLDVVVVDGLDVQVHAVEALVDEPVHLGHDPLALRKVVEPIVPGRWRL